VRFETFDDDLAPADAVEEGRIGATIDECLPARRVAVLEGAHGRPQRVAHQLGDGP
jgi:hypothetical protein